MEPELERRLARLARQNQLLMRLYMVLIVPVMLAATVTIGNADLVAEQDLTVQGDTTFGNAAGDSVSTAGPFSAGGTLDLTDHRIEGLAAPTGAGDAANRAYVDGFGAGTWSPAKDWTLVRVINTTVAFTGTLGATPSYFVPAEKQVFVVVVSMAAESTVAVSDDVGIFDLYNFPGGGAAAVDSFQFVWDPATANGFHGVPITIDGRRFRSSIDAPQGTYFLTGLWYMAAHLTQTGEIQLIDVAPGTDAGVYIFER